MRRRSERKKSTDVSSPAPVSRRTSRRSRQISETSSEKGAQSELSPSADVAEKCMTNVDVPEEVNNEEPTVDAVKNRSRNRTPVKDRSSPLKRKTQNITIEPKIDVIPEENISVKEDGEVDNKTEKEINENIKEAAEAVTVINEASTSSSPKNNVDINKPVDVLEIQAEDHDEDKIQSQEALNKNKIVEEEIINTENKKRDEESPNNELRNDNEKDLPLQEKSVSTTPKDELSIIDEKTDANVSKRKNIKNISDDSLPVTTPVLGKSPEIQEVNSEREEGEQTPSPERESRRNSTNNNNNNADKTVIRNQIDKNSAPRTITKLNIKVEHRSPSPKNKKASNVLFITNLVRPFTVLQLKGLLARTAIETRHALHGVRWPVSNPKCLIVEFAKRNDMDRAIQSTKDEQTNFGQENHRENILIGMGWNRDRNGMDEKRTLRPVREWDVGKKESLDREKNRDIQKRRSREREVIFGNREHDRNGKERRPRSKGRAEARSSSRSPARKVKKKENDPPLRL
ncbi:unnamed protein product [Ceratitis capitata]|uniref:(Mediterranean fruit fly) hypothetical protein n=1 Tax=Ceratitis capitata TaxID=7213 RepID=A0A811UHD8_CERCA|nr:unnamed protein product [Ceratitis capitata]